MSGVVNHVGLCVSDLARARRFYEGAFGFAFRDEMEVPDRACGRLLMVEPPVGLTACYLVLGDFVLELLHFERDGNAPRRARHFTEPGLTHLSLTVDDLEAACGRVADLGGEVLEETRVGHRAIMVRDPDGQVIELIPAAV
ncbi:MAG TPA: VOC family protein [Acidimicrobiales bacterium]|nr:VOC family protein [Acidimicrobiales bacterium]